MEGTLVSVEGRVEDVSPPAVPVAEIVAQWGRERPDLDASPLLVIGQMDRLVHLFDHRLRPPFATAGLGNGDFDVMAALRRAGAPFTLTPGRLATSLLVTTGAVTKRLDRLEARGLVRREVSGTDARGRLVTLTPAGVVLADELIEVHLANEASLLATLDEKECDQLADLLARLAASVQSDTTPAAEAPR